MKVGVIIAAGGSSSRMGQNKLLLELGGLPVIVRSVLAFDSLPEVKQIVVVTCDKDVEKLLKSYPFRHGITFAASGANRFQSVKNGFLALKDCDFTAIHDGARPFVSREEIITVFSAAEEYGAAIPAVPVKETVKEAKDGFVFATPDRERLFSAQTPQVFGCGIYERALLLAEQDGLDGFTDDSGLVERTGTKVKICPGSYNNIKLTTPDDIARAESIAQSAGKDG